MTKGIRAIGEGETSGGVGNSVGPTPDAPLEDRSQICGPHVAGRSPKFSASLEQGGPPSRRSRTCHGPVFGARTAPHFDKTAQRNVRPSPR